MFKRTRQYFHDVRLSLHEIHAALEANNDSVRDLIVAISGLHSVADRLEGMAEDIQYLAANTRQQNLRNGIPV